MSNAAVQLMLIKGAVAELPVARQEKVKECHDKLLALMAEYQDDDIALIAFALHGATVAAENA